MPKKTSPNKPTDLRDVDYTGNWAIDRLRRIAAEELREGPEDKGSGEIARGADLLACAQILERRIELLAARDVALDAERRTTADYEKRARKAEATVFEMKTTLGPPSKKPATAPPAAGKPCKDHDWNTDVTPPVCKLCGKTKSNRGRKSISNPAANVAVATVEGTTKIAPPSQPLPGVLAPAKGGGATPKRVSVELEGGATVDADDDPFAGGTVGAR